MIIRFILLNVFLNILLFTFCSVASSGEMSLAQTILKVQNRLNQTFSIRTEFEQNNYIKFLNTKTYSRGSLFIKKPGKIKILYSKPQKQTFISNRKSIWIYTPKFKQVLQRSISKTKQNLNPIIFLSEKINLAEEFEMSFSNTGNESEKFWKKRRSVVIKLIPKKSNHKFEKIGIKFLKIEVDSSDHRIHIFEYVDSMGNTSKFEFLNLVENEEIEDNVFEFTIPENIDVIRY